MRLSVCLSVCLALAHSISADGLTEEMANLRSRLAVVSKFNEFYVAVENARLAKKQVCVEQFGPKVASFQSRLDAAVDSCSSVVAQDQIQELWKCWLDVSQPIISEISINILFVKECTTQ